MREFLNNIRKTTACLMAVVLLSCPVLTYADSGFLAPVPKQQFFDANGNPLAGARIYFFASGTSTPLAAYSDGALTVALANPAVADAGGFLTYYLQNVAYKIIVKNSADVTQYTVDPVGGVGINTSVDIQGLAGETVQGGQAVYLSDGSGGKNNGSWYLTNSTNTYSSATANGIGIAVSNITSSQTGSIRILGQQALILNTCAAGLPAYIDLTSGELSTAPPASNIRAVGVCKNSFTVFLTPFIVPTSATSLIPGILSVATQTIGGQKQFDLAPQWKPGTSSTAAAVASGVIFTDSTARTNTGTGETTLSTTTLKGNSLAANGQAVRVTGYFLLANNANQKTYKVYLGATSITALSASTVANQWVKVEVTIMRAGAASEGVAVATLISGANPIVSATAFSETLSGDLTIKSTGQSNTASADISQSVFIVEVIG